MDRIAFDTLTIEEVDDYYRPRAEKLLRCLTTLRDISRTLNNNGDSIDVCSTIISVQEALDTLTAEWENDLDLAGSS
jgi:hypothetical protein